MMNRDVRIFDSCRTERYYQKGRQILQLLLEYCSSLGGKEFYYSTRSNNEASKSLALSCGFTYQYAEKKIDLRNGEPYELEVYHKEIKGCDEYGICL